jgi:hypothetical protein
MNPVVRLLLLIVFVAAIGGYGVHQYQIRRTEEEAKLDLLRIQRDLDERIPAAREITNTEEYSDEMRGLFRWYFGAIRDHDNRFPDQKDHERGWKDIEHKHAINLIKPPEFEQFEQNHATVADFYKMLQSGHYEPVLTGSSVGQHFDFLKIDREQHDGKSMIRFDFAWWGPQRKVQTDKSDTGITHRTEVSAAVQSISLEILDDKGKKYGHMDLGEPNTKVPDPDRYADLAPPNVVLGTFWLDMVPHQAQKAKLTVSASTRTVQGHELAPKFEWDLPLKDDWKMAQGQKWEGASEEVGDEEDAPQAAAANHGRKGK